MNKYISPKSEKLETKEEYCLNGESIVDELGIVQTTISDDLLEEE